MEQDKELKAISDVMGTLEGLDEGARKRVIKYVLERFNTSFELSSAQEQVTSDLGPRSVECESVPKQQQSILDIRMLKEQKQPKSAIQMVVLVAYYLQEAASVLERKETISSKDIEMYFKQASFKLPTGKHGAKDALNNTKRAGYLESVGQGAYKLNPVGYNLVVHGMPENSFSHGKKRKKISKPGRRK